MHGNEMQSEQSFFPLVLKQILQFSSLVQMSSPNLKATAMPGEVATAATYCPWLQPTAYFISAELRDYMLGLLVPEQC